MKKIFKGIVTAFTVLFVFVGIAVGLFFLMYTPTVTFDISAPTGDVTSGASGYLYGIAEYGVPSAAMCESVDISSASQKVVDGLQHPIGDIDHVYTMLSSTDYNVVYLQDNYDTWYYLHDEIMQQRADGIYDWQKLLEEDYLPKVRDSVQKLSETAYADKVVYCIYNECDNGVWFGETRETDDPYNRFGVWAEYNAIGRDNFNSAWKQTYDAVKKVNPDALIGGPGFCDYDHDEIEYFLQYCVENDCVPEIMIYHELHDDSVYYWQDHVDDYRLIEEALGMNKLPIIVTEYGRMQDNGYPGKMVQYITKIEDSKVYANNAYWRLSDNLNDVCADDNSPNANWWLMRWYADMEGQTLASTSHDLFRSDFKRSVRNKKSLDHQGFMGIAAYDDTVPEMTVVCGGRNGEAKIVFDNVKGSAFEDQLLHITIEETVYKGLYGIVNNPIVLQDYTIKQKGNRLTVEFSDLDEANAYHVTIRIADYEILDADIDNRPQRVEFEHGSLLGNAYVYDSYCPSSGDQLGMVGGMENNGDGVSLSFSVETAGLYMLDIVYGKANDGTVWENGKPNPNDRVHSVVEMTIDQEVSEIYLANTIKSEYTSCYSVLTELVAGEHLISMKHMEGTYVLDSLVITKADVENDIAVLVDHDRSTENIESFLVVAPSDGYYVFQTDIGNIEFLADNARARINNDGLATVYLRRGLNYIDFLTEKDISFDIRVSEKAYSSITLLPEDAILELADVKVNANGISYIDGISSDGGSESFVIDTKIEGDYRVTLLYSNNDEGGVHDYNVDLIERYVTVSVGDSVQNVFCRNTYSWDTFKTVTFNVSLKKGENTIVFTNDGSVRFADNASFAPFISTVSVNPVVLE